MIREVHPGLFVGDMEGKQVFLANGSPLFPVVVHACKVPCFKNAIGQPGKDSYEYLYAMRGEFSDLFLNLIDPDDPAFIPLQLMDAACNFIHAQCHKDNRVLIHCNQGRSRSPGIALLYLRVFTTEFSHEFDEACQQFKLIYPEFDPRPGMREFIRQRFEVMK